MSDDPKCLAMNEVVEHLKRIIHIWEEGRYSCDDFVNKLDWCLWVAFKAVDTPEEWAALAVHLSNQQAQRAG